MKFSAYKIFIILFLQLFVLVKCADNTSEIEIVDFDELERKQDSIHKLGPIIKGNEFKYKLELYGFFVKPFSIEIINEKGKRFLKYTTYEKVKDSISLYSDSINLTESDIDTFFVMLGKVSLMNMISNPVSSDLDGHVFYNECYHNGRKNVFNFEFVSKRERKILKAVFGLTYKKFKSQKIRKHIESLQKDFHLK